MSRQKKMLKRIREHLEWVLKNPDQPSGRLIEMALDDLSDLQHYANALEFVLEGALEEAE